MNENTSQELELIKILIPFFKAEIKKELDQLFLEKFLESFDSDSLTFSHIELISLCLLKRFIDDPNEVIEVLNDNISYYFENGSKMQVLCYLEETIKDSSLKELLKND